MSTATLPTPQYRRINLRAAAFAAIVLLVVGYPVYRLIEAQWHLDREDRQEDAVGAFTEINIKYLTDFPMDQIKGTNDDIPAKWRQMDGKRVLFVGEMVPGHTMAGFSDFELVYSTTPRSRVEPQIQHFIKCRVPLGKTVEYHPGLVAVKGTLHVGVTRDGGGERISSVYRLAVESVEPK
jgi:hypothetical protein